MRLSRLAIGTLVLAGITCIAANPACSSSSGSGFGGLDGGSKNGGHDSAIVLPDGTMLPPPDAQMMLGGRDASQDVGMMKISNEGGFNDAQVNIDATGCVHDAGSTGTPLAHNCIIFPAGADSDNECDGHHDPPAPFAANGSTGNGFDDNCNGLVDEGCACDSVGTTKPCYLVPADQTVGGVPVGWCASNSVGTVACAQQGENGAQWNGTCRGAQPPYAADVCAAGDFNCDSVPENAPGGCACKSAPIVCPTTPLVTVPYPPPAALPLAVDASQWFTDPTQVASATNWQWSMTGGDCDNILPNPTFGLYTTPDGSTTSPVGTTSTTLGMTMKEHGTVATMAVLGSTPSEVYPAFSLSGDYVLTASWELAGQPYTCTVQIQVRAPGLRAEACWSSEGQGDDLDLHMAKVNGFASECPNTQAWSDSVCANKNEDCFYEECYSADGNSVDWGYSKSPATSCNGWGSQTTGSGLCGNPRLDRDANGESGICNANAVNPNSPRFCGPENINLDAPADGDTFAVGVRFYARHGSAAGQGAQTHADVYCNGARILAAGYDPLPNAQNQLTSFYPQLLTPGADESGDMWKVGLVTTSVTGGVLSCTVVPTQSQTFDANRDGSSAYCVDNSSADGADSQRLLTSGGGTPATANALCFH